MPMLRFQCSGRVNKPLPSALVVGLPAFKDNMADFQAYAQKINEGLPNEEATKTVEWGNETKYIWFNIVLAIPMPIPQTLENKLPVIKDKIRQLKQYAVNTGEIAFSASWHICHHDEIPRKPCGEDYEI